MCDDKSVEQKVIELVARKSGYPVERISRASTFYGMGIDGDDAAELMQEYVEIFGIDMSVFDAPSYYGPEASTLFFVGRHPKKDLSIDLMIRSAEVGRWLG